MTLIVASFKGVRCVLFSGGAHGAIPYSTPISMCVYNRVAAVGLCYGENGRVYLIRIL